MEKNTNVNPIQEIPRQTDMVFDSAIRKVLHHEGLYSNDPSDPGGPTKYGISLRFAKGLGDLDGDGDLEMDIDGDGNVDIHDIKNLPIQKAIDIYKAAFWDKHNYHKLPPAVGIKVFDLAVNMGSRQSHILLQRAIRAALQDENLTEDGILGPKTLKAANRSYSPSLLSSLRSEAAGFYRSLIIKRPSSKKYINGWLTRAYS